MQLKKVRLDIDSAFPFLAYNFALLVYGPAGASGDVVQIGGGSDAASTRDAFFFQDDRLFLRRWPQAWALDYSVVTVLAQYLYSTNSAIVQQISSGKAVIQC